MFSQVLSEIRLLSSTHFDSRNILTIVFCGDQRFPEKLRHPNLVPLGSRIGVRMNTKSSSKEEMEIILKGVLEKAGNSHMMTKELIEILAEHSTGNLRVMMGMANNLLAEGVSRELEKLDEKLFFETFNPSARK